MPRCKKWAVKRSFYDNRFTGQINHGPRPLEETPSSSLP